METKTLAVATLVSIHWHESSWRLLFFWQDFPYLKACRLLYWDILGPTTNREAIQPAHQQKGCLKSSWAWACPPERQYLASPTNKQEVVLLIRKSAQASWTDSFTKGCLQEELWPCSLWNRNCNHRKLDKIKQ